MPRLPNIFDAKCCVVIFDGTLTALKQNNIIIFRKFRIRELPVDPLLEPKYGQEWIRTTEGISQQIYSLPRLATSVPTRFTDPILRRKFFRPGKQKRCGFRPNGKCSFERSHVYRTPISPAQVVFPAREDPRFQAFPAIKLPLTRINNAFREIDAFYAG
jgi:hypothetical protein